MCHHVDDMSARSPAEDTRMLAFGTPSTAQLLAVKSVAKLFATSEDTVRRLIASGRLRAINVSPRPGVGRAIWRVRVEDVWAFLDNPRG